MLDLLSILALGFFLGMRHATDPDHVIAVTTIVSTERSHLRSALIGAFWGVGHTLTIFIVGAAIILFKLAIPVRVGLSMELSVAAMLIILGLINIRAFIRSMPEPENGESASHEHPNHEEQPVVHSHSHSHGSLIHTHPHTHAHSHEGHESLAWMDRHFRRSSLYQYLRPFLIGTVHGLAGSAAVALLVLATIRNPRWAVGYLLVSESEPSPA